MQPDLGGLALGPGQQLGRQGQHHLACGAGRQRGRQIQLGGLHDLGHGDCELAELGGQVHGWRGGRLIRGRGRGDLG